MKKIFLMALLSCPVFILSMIDDSPNGVYIWDLKEKEGLVEIISSLIPQQSHENVKIELKRHLANEIHFANTVILRLLEGKKPGLIIQRNNRLTIKLNILGTYQIIIPHDADTKIKLDEGNINYLTPRSKAPTQLSIKSTTVNKWGDSGCHAINDQYPESWDYFWGDSSTPLTKLVTKKGHITVPE